MVLCNEVFCNVVLYNMVIFAFCWSARLPESMTTLQPAPALPPPDYDCRLYGLLSFTADRLQLVEPQLLLVREFLGRWEISQRK